MQSKRAQLRKNPYAEVTATLKIRNPNTSTKNPLGSSIQPRSGSPNMSEY